MTLLFSHNSGNVLCVAQFGIGVKHLNNSPKNHLGHVARCKLQLLHVADVAVAKKTFVK